MLKKTIKMDINIKNSVDFGKAVAQRRKELGYTQEDIAHFLGISKSFISDLENGKKTAELNKSLLLADTLSLDIKIMAR